MVSNETPTTIGKTMKTNDIKNIVTIVSTVITTGLAVRTHIKINSNAKKIDTKTNKLDKVAVDRAKKVIETRYKNGEFQNSNEAAVREALLTEIEFQKIALQYEEA